MRCGFFRIDFSTGELRYIGRRIVITRYQNDMNLKHFYDIISKVILYTTDV